MARCSGFGGRWRDSWLRWRPDLHPGQTVWSATEDNGDQRLGHRRGARSDHPSLHPPTELSFIASGRPRPPTAPRPSACRSIVRFQPENSASWIEVGTPERWRYISLAAVTGGLSCGRQGKPTHDGRRVYRNARTDRRAGLHPVTVRLHTSRLTLRQWDDADRKPYAELASDAVVMQYLTPLGVRETSDRMRRLGMTYTSVDDFDHPRLPEGHPMRRCVLYRLSRADWSRQSRHDSH